MGTLGRQLLLLFAALCAGKAADIELLNEFRPSPLRSAYGEVSKVEFSTGLVELDSKVLVHSPAGTMRNFRFAEPIWVIGYKSTIYDPGGKRPRENYLCHTFFGDQKVVQRQDQRMRAIYSDGFTQEVRLPDGFGLPFTPQDNVHWMPMFNNRDEQPAKVEMRIEVTVIRQKDLVKPLRRLYSTLRSVQLPHLFYIPPERHQHQTTFALPFNGRIHFMGTHIHPYGESIELFNVTRQERVWKGAVKRNSEGGMAAMETYSSAEGYPVKAGESYRLTSIYNNSTSAPIDAMAAVFLFFSMN